MCQEYDELLYENPEVDIMVKDVLLGLACGHRQLCSLA